MPQPLCQLPRPGREARPHGQAITPAPTAAITPSPASSLFLTLQAWFGPWLLALTFLGLAAGSWRKWPDPLVDFGQELYLAWQLSQGQVLYRDLAHLFGPFSQYLNAAAFRLFGVSFLTLSVFNLLILAAITGLLYRNLAFASDRFTATAAGLLFLLLFAFAQFLPAGNMNFVSPYVHETTHGIFCSLLLLLCLRRYQAEPRPRWLAGAGLVFGLAFLTKAEIFTAALAALLAGAGLAMIAPLRPGRKPMRALALFGFTALIPAAGFWLYFSRHLPWAQAFAATTGAWQFVFQKGIIQLDFYRQGLGWDHPVPNLLLLLKMSGWIFLAIIAALAGELALRRSRWPYAFCSILAAAGVFALLLAQPRLIPWDEIPRALPLTTLAAGTFCLAQVWRQRAHPEAAAKYSFLALWSVWALALLSKIILNTHLYHYGFYLAMPATLLLVVMLVGTIPARLQRGWGGGLLFRSLMLVLLAAASLYYLRISWQYYQAKTLRLGQDGDTILAYSPKFNSDYYRMLQALTWIQQETPPEASLVALPEGVMLNYLARRRNPTPYLLFDPVVMTAYGEPQVGKALDDHPPDYVVLVHKDPGEFGVGYFGQDPGYGQDILTWVYRHYRPVALFGEEPLQGERFGIKILQRL